jgi:Transposase DDE domain group 1
MQLVSAHCEAHVKSEADVREITSKPDSWPVETPGGRVYAEFDDDAPVTRDGALLFFFQFLQLTDRWQLLTRDIPLHYRSNNASDPKDVVGTLMLGALSGHWRYAHLNTIRNDRVNPALLGMGGPVSEDAARAALRRMDPEAALEWLRSFQLATVAPLLNLPWILDIDNTVKPIYGRQEGSEIGYNPHKPGRPSHNYHSYFVANLRLCLGVDVMPGKKHAAGEGMPGLWRLLSGMQRSHWPSLLRGDCAYGVEKILTQCEERELPYLFKLKHTPNVKKLVQRALRHGANWEPAGPGWQCMEAEIRLTGWMRARRAILVREAPAIAPLGEQARRRRDPFQPPLAEGPGWDPAAEEPAAPWSGKIAVLVTSLPLPEWTAPACAGLYRGRGDAENIIDEIKNQWGWGGFTTKSLGPTRIMANFVAVIFNLWRLYTRWFTTGQNREAVVTRPALMHGVGRMVAGGGQRRLKVTLLHGSGDAAAQALAAISKEMSGIRAATEQLAAEERWLVWLVRLYRAYYLGKRPPSYPSGLNLEPSG